MLIKRTKYLEHIRRFYESSLIKVLTGVRRCGKSVLLNQIKEDHMISINFEDVTYSDILTYNKLSSFITNNIKDNKKYYIFLDEI
jgi:hypothetical protein